MRKLSYVGLLIAGLFLFRGLSAQTSQFNLQLPPILPQAPNTATLGKFGDYQVSYFTGLPQISVPLYTIKTSAFEVPISLVYHASGIKVHEFPSWVGTGWALDAGGQIQRRMVGKPDEHAAGFLTGEPRKANDISYNSSDREYIRALASGQRDLGADIFSYSFPGGSGKFFFDRDDNYKPVLMPYAPVKISYPGALQFLSFDMRDASGNQYQFGKTYTENSYSILTEGNPDYQTSAWMLEKMISPSKKDTISFTYQTQLDNPPLERVDTWTVDDFVEAVNTSEIPNPYSPREGTFTSSFLYKEMYSSNHKEIWFNNGKVVFELDIASRQDFGKTNSSKALKRIKVFNVSPQGDKLLQTITFFHSYRLGRLTLDSLQFLDANSTVVNTYRFDYNTDIVFPSLNSETVAKDFWGYYNGKPYNNLNNNLIPKTEISFTPFHAGSSTSTITIGSGLEGSREPDSVYMQAGILKRIYYPTQGYTDFEYEANRHLDEQNNIKLAGGLRIKSIKSYDGISNKPLVKTYKYGLNESGVGRANYFTGTQFFYDEQRVEYWDKLYDPTIQQYPYLVAKKRRRTFYSNPTIDIATYDGAPVVYPWVTEYTGDGSNVLGKTVFQFRDSTDDLSSISNSSKAQVITRFFDRGQLLNKKTYKKAAEGQFQVVAENRYGYNTSFSRATKFGGLLLKEEIVRENISDYEPSFTSQDWYYNNISILSDDNYLTSTTSLTYNANDTTKFVQSVTSMDYGNFSHQQPTTITTNNSKNESQVINTKYPADYITSGTTTGSAILDSMLAKNMQTVEIEKWLTLTKPSESNKVIGGQINSFKKLSNGLIVPDKQNRLMVSSPLTNYQPGSVSSGVLQADGRYEPIINFNLFDNQGNVLEAQKSGNVKEAYLWGYNQAYPVAQAVNAAGNEIFFSGAEEWGWEGVIAPQYGDAPVSAYDDTKSRTGKLSARIDKPTSGEFYTHSDTKLNINLTADTKYKLSGWVYSNGPSADIFLFMKRQGEAFYFTYVDNVSTSETGKWVYIEKDINVPYDVKELNVRIDNNGGGTVWFDDIRLHPAAAQMTSYTYDPLIGVTSQTDINNRTTFYHYDGFGRLSLVLDHDRNILKKYCYNYQGQTESCTRYLSQEYSGYYDPQCANGQTPVSYYVSVPAGMFSAPTQQEANDLALQYAQQEANRFGICQPQSINLYFNNFTSDYFQISLYNPQTNSSYYFNTGSPNNILGQVPPGFYNIHISNPNNWAGTDYTFYVCGYYAEGQNTTISNVYVDDENNIIDIEYYYY